MKIASNNDMTNIKYVSRTPLKSAGRKIETKCEIKTIPM